MRAIREVGRGEERDGEPVSDGGEEKAILFYFSAALALVSL